MPSTAIRGFSYDEETSTLFVTFIDGDLYAYRGVEREVRDAFKAAISKGRFFSRRIRGRYPYAKLSQEAPDGTEPRGGRSDEADHASRDRSGHDWITP